VAVQSIREPHPGWDDQRQVFPLGSLRCPVGSSVSRETTGSSGLDRSLDAGLYASVPLPTQSEPEARHEPRSYLSQCSPPGGKILETSIRQKSGECSGDVAQTIRLRQGYARVDFASFCRIFFFPRRQAEGFRPGR